MRKFLVVAAMCAASIVAVRPMSAHHAFAAEFDANQPLILKGKVVKWELVNPHSWIHLSVKNADGSVTEWKIEGGSPNSLFRLGFNKNSLPAGTEIVVDGYRAKDGDNRAVGKDLTFADGKRLFMGGSAPGADGGKDAAK